MEENIQENQPSTNPADMNLMLGELTEMIQKLQNHQGPVNITPEIAEQIQDLEVILTWFNASSKELFQEPELSDAEIAAQNAALPDESKQFLKRAQLIKKDARKLLLNYSKAAERGKQTSASEAQSLKLKRKERRKLFKPLGGDKKWIPL